MCFLLYQINQFYTSGFLKRPSLRAVASFFYAEKRETRSTMLRPMIDKFEQGPTISTS